MNPKSAGSASSSPGNTPKGGHHGGGGSRHEAAEASDGEDLDESGLSDDDTTPVPPSGVGRGRRSGRGSEAVKETEEESSEDDEEEDEEEDEDEEEEGEDSSDVDVADCEKKREDFIDDLTDLEKQFAILREQLYRERITQIEVKLNEVRSGRAPEYLQPLEELQVNMKNRMEVGQVLKELRLANIQCKFDAEMLATEQNYESEKGLLWDSIKAELEDKIHRLEEDKQNVDISSGIWERSGQSRKRKADPMDPDRRKKPVTVTGPYIVYMLSEDDVLEDWTLIKKSLTQRKKTSVV
eukprot:maker-scaffold122_size333723-snap-gene-2.39 protein:Tk04133 transcript:maker-scaffold122_size333723-snap-gene-2.39-mRNA-1 annotation:"breast cancer metastasis-suppressor 1-like protein"